MFTPNPNKAQEPVFLSNDKIFTLHLKVNSKTDTDNSNIRGKKDTRVVDINGSRTVLLTKAVRWRATKDVKVEFNRDLTKIGQPEKYFVDTQGEFAVSSDIERVSFSSDSGEGLTKLYFEIA